MKINYVKELINHTVLLSLFKKNAAAWGRDCPCRGLQCGDGLLAISRRCKS